MLRDANPVAAQTLQDARGQTAWDIAKRHKGVLSLVWRWRVRAILRSQSSIQREEAGGGGGGVGRVGTEQVRLDGMPVEVPTVNFTGSGGAGSSIVPSAPPLPSSADKAPLEEGDEVCIVCWDGRADHAIVPCGHLCLCGSCSSFAKLHGTLNSKCPVCKGVAQSAMRVYHAGVPNPDASTNSGAASAAGAAAAAAASAASTTTVPVLGDATGSGLPAATGTFVGNLP